MEHIGPTGLFSWPRGLWDLCDSAKKKLLAFRNEPNDYFHGCKRPGFSGVLVQFCGSLPKGNRMEKCRLTSGIWSPSPSLMKNHHAAAPAIPACKDKSHLGPGKKRVISMLILIVTTHFPYQHGNNSKSNSNHSTQSTTTTPMTISSTITTNAQ